MTATKQQHKQPTPVVRLSRHHRPITPREAFAHSNLTAQLAAELARRQAK